MSARIKLRRSDCRQCESLLPGFARSSSSYLQERALDLRDVCFQLLQQIYGEQRFPAPGKLTQPAICMADELTPSQFLELDKNHLKGLLRKAAAPPHIRLYPLPVRSTSRGCY
ncbi:hypothetical protein ACLB1R_28630 [Escherichia coli]